MEFETLVNRNVREGLFVVYHICGWGVAIHQTGVVLLTETEMVINGIRLNLLMDTLTETLAKTETKRKQNGNSYKGEGPLTVILWNINGNTYVHIDMVNNTYRY